MMSCVENADKYLLYCLVIFSKLVASVSSDSTAGGPKTSYTKSMQRVLYLRLLQLMFLVDCVQSGICASGLARGCTQLTLMAP